MERVTVERRIDAAPEAVRAAMDDVAAFTEAGGFDSVTVDGDRIEIANSVGIATIELELALVDADAALAYRQVDGIFEEMETRYEVAPDGDASLVTATTEFAIDVALVGELMDATVIKRQRRGELEAQLDWLADAAERPATDATP